MTGFLLASGIQLDVFGSTSLLCACKRGHAGIVKLLVDAGVDIHEENRALYLACFGGHEKTVEVLLDAGADIRTRDYISLRFAISGDHVGVVRVLLTALDQVNDNTPELPVLLFTKGIDAVISECFVMACENNQKKIVKLFLDSDCVDGPRAYRARTSSLMEACKRGHEEIVRLLLAQGKLPARKIYVSGDVLFSACSEGHTEIIRLLAAAGADVNTCRGWKSELGTKTREQDRGYSVERTLLSTAAGKGHVQAVLALLDAGAHVQAHENIALASAIMSGGVQVVRVLLDAGADSTGIFDHQILIHVQAFGSRQFMQSILQKAKM